jgi:hypothetical protein
LTVSDVVDSKDGLQLCLVLLKSRVVSSKGIPCLASTTEQQRDSRADGVQLYVGTVSEGSGNKILLSFYSCSHFLVCAAGLLFFAINAKANRDPVMKF